MKELIIARHAKSSWKNPELADIERPLNKRGYTDANRMGKFLVERRTKPDIFITSPAVRAFSTATIYARYINIQFDRFKVDSILYSGSLYDIEDLLINLPSDINNVMIFGHNPTFTNLANYYTNAEIENIPTSGIVSVRFKVVNWEEIQGNKGKIYYFQYPKNLS